MAEREKPGELEAFHDEIKKIVKFLDNTNGDAMHVKKFDELDETDMRHWQENKSFLSAIDGLDPKDDPGKIKQQLQELEKKAEDAALEVQKILSDQAYQDKATKLAFNAWLNNINPLSFINITLRRNIGIEKIKNMLRGHIALYVHDSWKKADSNKIA